jgi:hypothetical protein
MAGYAKSLARSAPMRVYSITASARAKMWLRKGFGFSGPWTVCEQNRLLALCFGLPGVNKA